MSYLKAHINPESKLILDKQSRMQHGGCLLPSTKPLNNQEFAVISWVRLRIEDIEKHSALGRHNLARK